MLIVFLARYMLGELRPSEDAHLLGIEEAKIHRLTNVAIGFLPWFAHFKNLDGGKLEASTFHDRRNPLEQLGTMLHRNAAPMIESPSRRFDRAFGFRNSRLRHFAYDLVRGARV